MATKVNRHHRSNHHVLIHRPAERDTTAIANPPIRLRHGLLGRQTLGDLTYVTDRRRFNFHTDYPTINRWGSRNRFIIPTITAASTPIQKRNVQRPTWLNHRVVMADSGNVLVCIRRKRRREVIHALGRAGTRVRKPKSNAMTKYHCR